ncbi:barstar family protein [Streptomyces sp. NPDC090077]|uniref:barstar family protein n=1 Tax=Streptomyces sp. NPDC090077 TaxID=3365938 RepID=UPI003811CB02
MANPTPTTPTPTLTERRSPWVVFTRADDPWVTAETAALRARGGRVVRLDGRAMPDPASVFTAFDRALSFPGYFGRNWHALVDCLHDWHGHGGDTKDVAVLIDDADALLDAGFTGIFVSMLCEAAWKANLKLDADGIPDDDPPFTLHFVFLLAHVPPTAFAPSVARGPDVEAILHDDRLVATLTDDHWPEPAREG